MYSEIHDQYMTWHCIKKNHVFCVDFVVGCYNVIIVCRITFIYVDMQERIHCLNVNRTNVFTYNIYIWKHIQNHNTNTSKMMNYISIYYYTFVYRFLYKYLQIFIYQYAYIYICIQHLIINVFKLKGLLILESSLILNTFQQRLQ